MPEDKSFENEDYQSLPFAPTNTRVHQAIEVASIINSSLEEKLERSYQINDHLEATELCQIRTANKLRPYLETNFTIQGINEDEVLGPILPPDRNVEEWSSQTVSRQVTPVIFEVNQFYPPQPTIRKSIQDKLDAAQKGIDENNSLLHELEGQCSYFGHEDSSDEEEATVETSVATSSLENSTEIQIYDEEDSTTSTTDKLLVKKNLERSPTDNYLKFSLKDLLDNLRLGIKNCRATFGKSRVVMASSVLAFWLAYRLILCPPKVVEAIIMTPLENVTLLSSISDNTAAPIFAPNFVDYSICRLIDPSPQLF